MRTTPPRLLTLLLFLCFTTPSLFAVLGHLDKPGLAWPKSFPAEHRAAVQKVLERPGCKFLGGIFLNSFTTLRYSSSTQELSMFLDELSKCPGVTLSVSFVDSLPKAGDWHVHHHTGKGFRFHVRISLESKNIKVSELVLPVVRTPLPRGKQSSVTR
ncbi:MAG: hypothetical protein ACI9VS_000884 [Candidatus Binatia bacterium]|jgi:hypothetical protein